jgi:hypothetical protein
MEILNISADGRIYAVTRVDQEPFRWCYCFHGSGEEQWAIAVDSSCRGTSGGGIRTGLLSGDERLPGASLTVFGGRAMPTDTVEPWVSAG